MTTPPASSAASARGTPPAEIDISDALVRALLRAQHPDLAGLAIEPVASGWDNATFRVGEHLAARLPRRAAAAALILHEQAWLPHLQGRLPLQVPAPLRSGTPQAGYPWPWSLVPWIAGTPADLAPPVDADAGDALAAFFEALHQPAPADAPSNPFRGVPLAARSDLFEQRFARAGQVAPMPAARIRALWDDACAAPAAARALWLHGDLHPRNVLVDGGRIVAVIDWGDMARGDHATDLAAVWMLLPQRAQRERALARCPHATPADWRRARGWALLFGLMLLDAGLADDPRMRRVAERCFANLMQGP